MGARHPHIPPAAAVPPTTARRACPSTTRPTTATSTPPSDTHSNGTASAGEATGWVTAAGGRSSPPSPSRGQEYASRWEEPVMWRQNGPRFPGPVHRSTRGSRRMRDTIDHHSQPAASVSSSTSTHSDTNKNRYWVTTIRSPVAETTPPERAPSGRSLRCPRRSSPASRLAGRDPCHVSYHCQGRYLGGTPHVRLTPRVFNKPPVRLTRSHDVVKATFVDKYTPASAPPATPHQEPL